MAGEHYDDSDFDVDSFLNLDAMEEEISVEALLEAAAAAAQPRQQDHPASLVQPQTVPNVQVFPVVQAPASDHVLHYYSQVLAPQSVQHQQIQGEACLDDQMMTQAPIPHAHDPNVQAIQVQQHLWHPQMLVESSSASGFHDEMMMPVPIAHAQTNIQATDQVLLATDVLQQQWLDESTTWAFDFQDFDEETTMMASVEDDEFSGPPCPDSLPMYEYLAQNGHYDIAEALMSDEVNLDGAANGVPEVGPMEDEVRFVPLMPERLDCGGCRVVRQIRFHSETREEFIRLHGARNSTFEHAVLDRKYIGDNTAAPKAERLYVDFSRRTTEWVFNFIANIVRSLKNETTGIVEDSDEPANTLPIVNDAYQLMEIAMLKIIDSTPENVEMPMPSPLPAGQLAMFPPPPPPVAQTAPAMEAASNSNLSHEIIKPTIFESRPFVREEQSSESGRVHSTRHQEKMASSSEEDKEEEKTRRYLHEIKEKAQRELDVHKQSLAVKRFCRKKNWTWMLLRIKRINNNIIKLEKNAFRFTLSRLLVIRDTFERFVDEKEKIGSEIMRAMKKERESNGSYPFSKNGDEAGPSGTKKGGAL